jgi:hypothetical protein
VGIAFLRGTVLYARGLDARYVNMNDRRRWFFHSHPAPSRHGFQSISSIAGDFYCGFVPCRRRPASADRNADVQAGALYGAQ